MIHCCKGLTIYEVSDHCSTLLYTLCRFGSFVEQSSQMTKDREGTQQSLISLSKGEVLCRFKMASSCKGLSVQPINESCYSVMDEDFNPSLHILDQSERELCGNELYFVLLHC